MTPKEKAIDLIRQYMDYTSNWTTISKPSESRHQAIFEAGMKKGRAKQCAIILIDQVIKSMPIMPCDEYGISAEQYWQQVKTEIENI